ncbi:hypothetical protein PCL_11264 [Purpureocillium lilacinum]|uniref:Chromo domain-containing protein n=1 Tax=Purpureocillium lilacinum TaxID=33203 RepID=A0A2U3DPZ3_PURLI|nr:hypothetical protein PCL_11264 [Purpureocillium lilacinum]
MSSFFASILNSRKGPGVMLKLSPLRNARTAGNKQPRNSPNLSMTPRTEAARNGRNPVTSCGVATTHHDDHYLPNTTKAYLGHASVGTSNTTSTAIVAPGAVDTTDALVEAEGERVGEGKQDAQVVAPFRRFVQHRWAGDLLEIQVEWDEGGLTWEPEVNLHEDAPDTLFAYWKSKGARPTNPADPDLYSIFAIRMHSSNRKQLLVEWVGYGPKDMTWVSRSSMEKTAPEIVTQYWESVKLKRRKRPRTRHH